MKTIILIEDDTTLQSVVKTVLEKKGYRVQTTKYGSEGLDFLERNKIDLIVLDMGLPDMDGEEILGKIRKFSSTIPVIIASARDSIDQKISGLYSGADDYITKPYDFKELVARVDALLRRNNAKSENKPIISKGEIYVDMLKQQVFVNEERVHISNREYDLLIYLMEHADEVVTYETISKDVWDVHIDRNTNYINVYVSYIRTKLRDVTDSRYIETIRGVGFKFHSNGF